MIIHALSHARQVRRGIPAYCLFLSIFCGACGGESDLAINPAHVAVTRPRIDSSRVGRGRLTIPSAEPFNLKAFDSGQEGSGRGAAEAVGNNGAVCRADVTSGGSARGSFLLGYTFDQSTDAPQGAILRIRLRHSASIETDEATGDNQTPPVARTRLSIVVRDTNGIVQRNEPLAASTCERGPRTSSGTHELAFDARFEPGRGYYVLVGGECEAKGGDGRASSAVLQIEDCSFEIDWGGAARSGTSPASTRPAPNPAS